MSKLQQAKCENFWDTARRRIKTKLGLTLQQWRRVD